MMKKTTLIVAGIVLFAAANLPAAIGEMYNAPLLQDAYVDSVNTTSTYNTSILQSRGYGGEDSPFAQDVDSEQRTFLMFDVSWLRGKTILSAEFGIYLNAYSEYSDSSMVLFHTQDTWSETNITWNSSLALANSEIGFSEQIDSLRYYTWNNLTDWVITNLEDGSVSLRLNVADESVNNYAYFNSGENAANIPYLHIQYLVPEPATLLTLSLGALAALRRKAKA